MIETKYFNNLGTFFTEEMQLELLQKTICVFGCGGFGSWVVEFLSRLGVKKIICFDDDIFEEEDICQKNFISYENIGMKKINVALQNCKKINPNITYEFYDFNYDTRYSNLILDSDLIIDVSDMDLQIKLDLINIFQHKKEMYYITGFLSEHSFIASIFNLVDINDQKDYIHYSTIMDSRYKELENKVTTTKEPALSGPSYLAALGGSFLISGMINIFFNREQLMKQGKYNFLLNSMLLMPVYNRSMFND